MSSVDLEVFATIYNIEIVVWVVSEGEFQKYKKYGKRSNLNNLKMNILRCSYRDPNAESDLNHWRPMITIKRIMVTFQTQK